MNLKLIKNQVVEDVQIFFVENIVQINVKKNIKYLLQIICLKKTYIKNIVQENVQIQDSIQIQQNN